MLRGQFWEETSAEERAGAKVWGRNEYREFKPNKGLSMGGSYLPPIRYFVGPGQEVEFYLELLKSFEQECDRI